MTDTSGVVLREDEGVRLIVFKEEDGKEMIKMTIEGHDTIKVPNKDPFKDIVYKSFNTLVEQRKEERESEETDE